MGAEIFDVEVNLDGILINYGQKVTSKKNKSNKMQDTFNGDVSVSGKNTGGTISFEGLVWPTNLEDQIALEEKLESNQIKTVTIKGTAYTTAGDAYTKMVIGNQVTVTNDEDEWTPTEGVSQKLEFAVNQLIRKVESI